ncbi:MAG: histidinol-phosphatase [Candidatus Methylacidiphilales bacterium]
MVYETHMHTPLCKHAIGTISEYADVAAARGLKGITVTCHCPLPDGMSSEVRMSPEQWGEYLDMVAQAREEAAGTIDILLGLESDYLPGLEPWLEKLHSSASLHYILGSVHPQIHEYKERYLRDNWPLFHRQYFSSLVEAAQTGLFDCLSHPDLVKNVGSEHWNLESHFDHILHCLDAIAETGIAMELNTSGRYKTIPEMNPSFSILKAMRERGIPVVVGADAHCPERVCEGYQEAYMLLESAGYSSVRFFKNRQAADILIRDARHALQFDQ